ncbi:peptidoglycan-binding protein, partial [Cereibacter changlensis JA139]
MRILALPLLLALTAAPAAMAQNDFRDIVSGVAQSMIAQQADQQAFQQAQGLNSDSGYRSYLARFPKGAFREDAERALSRLGAANPDLRPDRDTRPDRDGRPGRGNLSAAAVEADLGLSRSQRVQIQTQLTSLGYATGGADGLWGSNTRSAIGRWQTANKQSSTGYVTARQVRLIDEQAGPVAGNDRDDSQVDDPLEERLLGLTAIERREVQRRLTALGYSTRGVDG